MNGMPSRAERNRARLPRYLRAPRVGAMLLPSSGMTMLARMPAGRGRVLPNVSRAILGNGSRREDIRTTIAVMQDQARELL